MNHVVSQDGIKSENEEDEDYEDVGETELGLDDRIYLQIYDYETKEFSGLTTYHGLVRIYNSNTWPSRIFWCVVVLCCLSLFMIHCGYLLLGYHSKPTLFQINTVAPREGMEFPDLTICTYNPIVSSKLTKWNISHELAGYLLHSYSSYSTLHETESLQYENDLNDYLLNFSHNNSQQFSLQDFLQDVGPTCQDMVVSCSFNGFPIANCCNDAVRVHTDLGYCIRFQGSKLKRRQYLIGKEHGYHFIIDANSHWKPDSYPASFADNGAHVLIYENKKETFLRSQGFDVRSGSSVYAAIETINKTSLEKKNWGICQPDWDPALHGEILLAQNYTASHCEWNCQAQIYLKLCNCLPMSLYINSSYEVCSPLQLLECGKLIRNIDRACTCDKECEVMEYNVKYSYSKLSKRSIRKYIHRSDDYVENSILSLWIFFRTISYDHYEQQKQLQTADLLSNIAGSMGLFLGMSTVTLLEIFIYLFKSVWGTVNTERQQQFVNAIMEEEEERRQSLVIIDEPMEDQSMLGEPIPSGPRLSKRISVIPGRRESRIIIRRDSTIVPPSAITHRRSIAIGALQRNDTEASGEILGGLGNRRASTVLPYRNSPMTHRLSVQHNEEGLHLSVINPTRRRSSINPKHFLV
ncbi:unnamed protein product [Auanema sp. JU1783]|nr:unnamed protein product [Auanema sp. JU1783]